MGFPLAFSGSGDTAGPSWWWSWCSGTRLSSLPGGQWGILCSSQSLPSQGCSVAHGPSVLSGSQQSSLWFCLYSGIGCLLCTRLSVVPPPLCMVTHHSCQWDPPQSYRRQLDDVVLVVQCCAVMGKDCEQQWTEHTALRCPCAQCGAGGVIFDTDCLRSSCQKVQNLVGENCVQAQQAQLPSHVLGVQC